MDISMTAAPSVSPCSPVMRVLELLLVATGVSMLIPVYYLMMTQRETPEELQACEELKGRLSHLQDPAARMDAIDAQIEQATSRCLKMLKRQEC